LFKLILFFLLANSAYIVYLAKSRLNRTYILRYSLQVLQEKLNILNDQYQKEQASHITLQEKIQRYQSLRKVVEALNKSLDLASVAHHLTSIAFTLIANGHGQCMLYLLDAQNQLLQLFKSEKEDKSLIIKAKEGDAFDFWVLRHSSPLLIENTLNDFRFDPEKLKFQQSMPVSSVISVPLVSGSRFLGLLRLNSSQVRYFSQEDLRFLAKICDLGAVALENSELFEKTQDLAIHDGLTGLYTKGHFSEHLKEECRRGIRHGSIFSLLMLDIDFFKNYNDKFGHTAGDIVLKELSRAIADSLKRKADFIGRFGGEEFCIILDRTDKQKAARIAELLRKKIEDTLVILRRQQTSVTVSIGVASFPADALAEDELVQKADKAMYQAKQEGRNRVVVC